MEYPLRIAVCDDTEADAALLEKYIEKSGVLCERRFFKSGEELLGSFRAGLYDLIFMDIYMGGIRGLEAVKIIRETDPIAVIAFVTVSLDHTLESYRLNALKYLEKPVSEQAVKETVELALMKRKSRAFVNLLIGGKRVDVPVDGVLYFEKSNMVVKVAMTDRVIQTGQNVKLDGIEERLPSPPFLRCHRSFIVNLRYVKGIDTELCNFVMVNGDKPLIRRASLKKIKAAYEDWLFALPHTGGTDNA